MSFLNPFFLFGALTLAIPIVIHMVRREKSETVPFSSLMFLLKVPKHAIRQQKIKNLMLMALRLLILALLAGSFTRPYFTQNAQHVAPAAGDRGIVLMLDNSYSMRYGTNFERMKNEAIQRIERMASGDRMAIVAFNESATMLSMPSPDRNALKAAVDRLEPSYAGTRYYEAFALADRTFSQLAGQEKQLVIVSDFQRNGWNRSSRESVIGSDVKAEFVNLSIENPVNAGIDSVIVDHTSFTRIYTGRVVARLHNHRKDESVNVPVTVSINDREAARKIVQIPANGTSIAEFTGFDLPIGFSKAKVRIEAEDPLQLDNEFLFSLNRRDKLNVLVVDAGRSRQSLYLRQAYSSSPELPFAVKVVPVQNVTPEELVKHQVLILNDVPRLSERVLERMDELRKKGQGQLVILGENTDIDWWSNAAALPVRPVQKIFVGKDRGKPSFSLTTYDSKHNIFKPFELSMKITLATAQYFAYVETEPKPGATVLAKFENSSPVIVESSPEDRGLLVFTSTVDNRWNDFPLKPSFLPLFHEIVNYLSRYSESRGWYALGEGVPVIGGVEAAGAAVIDPNGERESLGELSAGQQRFFTPELPGFYEVRVGPDVRMLAVNPPSPEGNLESMPPEDLLASVQRTQGETQAAGFVAENEEEDYARRQLGWWYLLLFALLAGVAEIYIANRAYRTS